MTSFKVTMSYPLPALADVSTISFDFLNTNGNCVAPGESSTDPLDNKNKTVLGGTRLFCFVMFVNVNLPSLDDASSQSPDVFNTDVGTLEADLAAAAAAAAAGAAAAAVVAGAAAAADVAVPALAGDAAVQRAPVSQGQP